jgi:hypothetical protein
MRFGLAFIISIVFSSIGLCGGDVVNNGGGLAEKNIYRAFSRLEKTIDLCLVSAACKLTHQQRLILNQIKAGVPEERNYPAQIQYSSEKSHPGEFVIDGDVKVAKTGRTVGSSIIINLDLLYLKNEDGFYIPMSVPEATAVLIHELGHHYGDYSHSELDLLGEKVSSTLQKRIYTTPLLPWSPEISMVVINDSVTNLFPEVILYVGNTVVDLTQQYYDLVKCPVWTIPIPIGGLPDIDIFTKRPEASSFHNISWDKYKEGDKGGLFSVQGNVSNKCADGKNPLYRSNDFKMSIRFRASKESGIWQLDSDSVKMFQKRDPWWKVIEFL